jgi:hypothetical protein
MTQAALSRAHRLFDDAVDLQMQMQELFERIECELATVRQTCEHSEIGACRQHMRYWFQHRLCLRCGVLESENGAGFHILTAKNAKMFESLRELKAAFELPTVTWNWCYGLGGHELPAHPVLELASDGSRKRTRCAECAAAMSMVQQYGLGRCAGCGACINPSYNHCKSCLPRRRKARQLDEFRVSVAA